MKKKLVMEIYGWVIRKWTRLIRPNTFKVVFAEKCVCENWSYLKRKSISVWRLIEDLRDFRINAAVASRVDSHFTCIIPHPVKWEKKRVHLWSISSLLLLLLYSAKWIPLLAFLKASWRFLIGTFNFGHFYCNTAPLVPLSFEEIHSLIHTMYQNIK